jgi:hypothetical protein
MLSHKEPLAREHLGAQLIYALKDEILGRRTLVQRTGLTESVVRTELEKLAAQKFVRFEKAGTLRTTKAKEAYIKLFKRIVQIEEPDLTELKLDAHNRAALVRAGAAGLKTWALRDLAVREGASGSLFIVRRQAELCLFDETTSLAKQNPIDGRRLEKVFPGLAEGDLIVIVFAPTRANAGAGLWRILTEIIPITERSRS